MANPFRNPSMRLHYDNVTSLFQRKHHMLIHPDGSEGHGNSIATMFWHGYHGRKLPLWFTTRADRDTLGYVVWCAGRDCAKEVKGK